MILDYDAPGLDRNRYFVDFMTECPECEVGWIIFRGVVYAHDGEPATARGAACHHCGSEFAVELIDTATPEECACDTWH